MVVEEALEVMKGIMRVFGALVRQFGSALMDFWVRWRAFGRWNWTCCGRGSGGHGGDGCEREAGFTLGEGEA